MSQTKRRNGRSLLTTLGHASTDSCRTGSLYGDSNDLFPQEHVFELCICWTQVIL